MLDAHGDFVHERTLLVLIEAAQRLGIEVDVSALAPTRARSGDEMVVPTGEYQAVLRQFFADPRETLGIDLAEALPVEALGLWGFLLRTSPTFGAMLRRAKRFVRVFFRYTRVALAISDRLAALTCDHPEPSPFGHREQEVCFFLGQWLTLGRTLIGDEVATKEVHMRWSGPAEPAPFETFFGCPVYFGRSDDALVFHRRMLDLPLPEHTPELSAMLEDYAVAVIHRLGNEATFADRVREAISEGTLTGESDELAIAKSVGITTRTLRRRLAKSSLSFREIRQNLLRTRAESMLRDDRLPIAEISYLLGYAEPSTFHRAFRSWTGLTPGKWREQHSLSTARDRS